jgi:MFS family permease
MIEKRIGAMFASMIGCSLVTTGVLLTYFTLKTYWYFVLLTYGVIVGLGVGLAYVPPLACGYEWFPDHKGLVSGFIVSGFGLGSFVFSQVQTAFINPHNVKSDSEGYFVDSDLLHRVPQLMLLTGGIYVAMQLMGCLLMRYPPPHEESTDLEGKDNSFDLQDSKFTKEEVVTHVDDVPIFTPKQALRTPVFYLLFTMFCLNQTAIAYISAIYKSFGDTFIDDDKFLSTMGAVAAVFNVLGRVGWGYFIDRWSIKITNLLVAGVMSIFVISVYFSQYVDKWMYAIFIWIIFTSVGGTFAIFPACTGKTYGRKHVGIIYGLITSGMIVSGVMMALLNQVFFDLIGYIGLFGMICALVGLSSILSLFYRMPTLAGDISTRRHTLEASDLYAQTNLE